MRGTDHGPPGNISHPASLRRCGLHQPGAIELDSSSRASRASPQFAHPTPEYVRFELPPVIEALDPIELESGVTLEARLKYYDYGVISLGMDLQFACEWDELVRLSGEWIAAPNIESRALEVTRCSLQRVAPALVKPYDSHSTEDYYIIELREAKTRMGSQRLLPICWHVTAQRSRRSFAASRDFFPTWNGSRFYSPACRIILPTCSWWDGRRRWFMTRRKALPHYPASRIRQHTTA